MILSFFLILPEQVKYIVSYSKILVVIKLVKYLAFLPLSLLRAILWFRRVPPLNSMVSHYCNFIIISSTVCAIICCHESCLKNPKPAKQQKCRTKSLNSEKCPKIPGTLDHSGLWVWKNNVCHVLYEDIKHICVLHLLGQNRFSKVDWDWEMLELDDQDFQCQSSVPKFKFWKTSARVGCLVVHMEQDVIFNILPSGTVLTSPHFAVLSLK